MYVAECTEMPVPPTELNRGRNDSVLQARSDRICYAVEFLFSALHTGLMLTESFRTEVSSQVGDITKGKENAQLEEHSILRKQEAVNRRNVTAITGQVMQIHPYLP